MLEVYRLKVVKVSSVLVIVGVFRKWWVVNSGMNISRFFSYWCGCSVFNYVCCLDGVGQCFSICVCCVVVFVSVLLLLIIQVFVVCVQIVRLIVLLLVQLKLCLLNVFIRVCVLLGLDRLCWLLLVMICLNRFRCVVIGVISSWFEVVYSIRGCCGVLCSSCSIFGLYGRWYGLMVVCVVICCFSVVLFCSSQNGSRNRYNGLCVNSISSDLYRRFVFSSVLFRFMYRVWLWVVGEGVGGVGGIVCGLMWWD